MLTLFVVLAFVICIIFAAVVLFFNYNGIEVSEVLIQFFYTVIGIEFGATAAIQISKYRLKKKMKNDMIQLLKDNNLPVEKSDIISESDEEEYDESEITE